VAGAVTGGGLTVIASAPNPADQAILNGSSKVASHPGGSSRPRSCRRRLCSSHLPCFLAPS
jgi:hypothetical protein